MKLVRPFLFTLAGLALVVAISVALMLTPAVQHWAVQRALAGHPELKVEYAQLSAGLSGAELSELKLSRAGLQVRAARLEVDYSLASFLFRNRVDVPRLIVRGLEIDATRLTPSRAGSGAAGAPVAAPGAITQMQLPWEIAVGVVDVSGRVLLSGGKGGAALPADFKLEGGGIAPGQEGSLRLRIDLTDASPDARVKTLRTAGELRVRQTTHQTFDHADLALTLDASGPHIAQPNQLKLAARMDSTASGATYTLKVDTVQSAAPENLLTLEANAPAQEPRFTGRWSAQIKRAQVEPFVLGAVLPAFSLNGAGNFSFRTDNADTSLQGDLQTQISGLEVLDPAMRSLGLLKLDTRFDVAAAQGNISVNQFALRLEGERPVAAFEIKRALTFETRTKALQIATGNSEVGRLQIHGLPLAWIRPFVTAVDVSGGQITGEFIVTGNVQQLAVSSVAPLRISSLNVVKDGHLLLDRAEFAVSPSLRVQLDRAALTLQELSLTTPAGDSIRSTIELEAPISRTPAVTVRARTEANLPRLLTVLFGLGHLRSLTEADVTISAERLNVRSYRSELANGAGKRLFSANTARAFAVDLRQLQVVNESKDEVEIGRVSFEKLALHELPLLPANSPLSGELAAGGFVAAAKGSRVFLRATAPLRVSNLTLSDGAQRVVEGVSIQASPTLEFGGLADWKISDGATALRDRANTLLAELNSEAYRNADGLRASTSFNTDLAALGSQPLFASLRALSAGRAAGELRAGVQAGVAQLELRSTVNGLVARQANQALPVANLNVRLTRAADGRLTLEVPILLDRLGQRSDLRLDATGIRQAGVVAFNARVTSDHLELADLLALSALAGGPAPGATAPTAAVAPTNAGAVRLVAPDRRPGWSLFSGEASVELKDVVRGKDWAMKNFTAIARVAPESVKLEKATAVFNGKGALNASAELAFRGGAQPYALQSNFSLTEFDVGALLKALEPDKPATLEGVFTVKGDLAGSGPTVDLTLERARGNFELQSRQGVFRGLRRTSDKVSVATKAVDAVAALGSLFGTDKVKGAAEKVAGQSYLVDQLAQSLAELTFDQFVIRAARDEKLNYRVEEISLVSPEVRLNARGTVTHVAGKPLLEQPLVLSYQLAARGKTEQVLGKLKALDGSKDELGYSKAKDLGQITGTLARPVPNELFQRLIESKLGDFFN